MVLLSLALLMPVIRDIRPGAAFACGLMHGLVAYGIALYWMWNLFSVLALVLFLLMGFFTALFCLFFNWSARYMQSPYWHVLLAAVFWTAVEYFRCEVFILRFPWISVGSSFGPSLLSPLLGVYGATFLMVATAACFMTRKTILTGMALLVVVAFLSVFPMPTVRIDPVDSIRVTLVQDESSQLDRYLDLTNHSDATGSELIVWPEYALPYDVRQNTSEFDQLKRLSRQQNSFLLVGTQTKTGAGAWYNTALLVGPEGAVGEYYKNRPVHFFGDGIAGQNPQPIDSPMGRMGTPICFDCDYTRVVRTLAARGAEFFAVPSYDKQSWSLTQHRQHSLLFRHRAAETRRWFAVAASSGYSQFIDPNGNVTDALPPMVPGVLSGEIARRSDQTFFVQYGWLFPWCNLLLAGGFLLYMLIRTFVFKREDDDALVVHYDLPEETEVKHL